LNKIGRKHNTQATYSGCLQNFSLSEIVSEFSDRIKQCPLDARTIVNYEQNPSEQNGKTLIITVPSRLSGMGQNEQWFMRFLSVTSVTAGILFGGWIIYKTGLNCKLFFEVFDFWTAMKYSAFYLCVMLPVAAAYLIIFYFLVRYHFCCWTLRIDADEVIVERRYFWKNIVVAQNEIKFFLSSKETKNFSAKNN
jgi:hypothetical protein